jgi:GST-like protein
VSLFESGAILLYLAEKTGKLIGSNASEKAVVTQWLMFQMGGLGPMLGQLGFFYKFAGSQWEDKRPQQRYIDEAKRLLAVLEKEMAGKDWIAGEYSIADIALVPWLRAMDFYGVKDVVGWDNHPNLIAWRERFEARPAVQVGLNTPPRPE